MIWITLAIVLVGLLTLKFCTERNRRFYLETFPVFHPQRKFERENIPNMSGKVCVITGGNSGLGLETARQLAKNGATVVIAGRNESKCLAAVDELKKEKESASVEYMHLELASFRSIQDFVRQFTQKHSQLDVLMLNAGKRFEECKPLVEARFEPNIGVHHLGHAYLTFLLMPTLLRTIPSRVIVVASHSNMNTNRIEYSSLITPKHYSPQKLYGQSKLANIMFTRRLALELQKQAINTVFVNCLHPGFVLTDFSWMHHLPCTKFVGYRAEEAALTPLYLACHADIVEKHITGEYFYPIANRGLYGSNTSPAAADWDQIDEFWQWTVDTLRNLDPQLHIPFTLK